MASDAYLRLSRLLLQQSDRHPIRALSGEDLQGYDARAVRAFEQHGLIVRERDLGDADGVVFHPVGEEVSIATSYEDGTVEAVSPLGLATYRIEYLQFARLLRDRFALGGPPVEALSHKVHALGARHSGRRRQEVYLVRCLRPERALETLFAVRAHASSDARVVVLTPTERELPRAVMRQIDGLQISAVAGLLKRQALPLAVRLPLLTSVPDSAEGKARLVIDSGGHVATLDGVDLELRPREFGVLLLLANEAKDAGGFVRRDLIGQTIRDVTRRDSNEEQIDKAMSVLRSALNRIPTDPLVEMKRAVGYRLTLASSEIEVR